MYNIVIPGELLLKKNDMQRNWRMKIPKRHTTIYVVEQRYIVKYGNVLGSLSGLD